ncbi:MAG: AraC family transcriptional regulator, partial [Nostoc sp.]
MTITISRQAHFELFQETVECSQHPDPNDVMDVIYKYPQPLGQGYWREIALRQGLVLRILNLQLSDRIIEQLSERAH